MLEVESRNEKKPCWIEKFQPEDHFDWRETSARLESVRPSAWKGRVSQFERFHDELFLSDGTSGRRAPAPGVGIRDQTESLPHATDGFGTLSTRGCAGRLQCRRRRRIFSASAALAQLVRAPDCGSGGPPFEPGRRYHPLFAAEPEFCACTACPDEDLSLERELSCSSFRRRRRRRPPGLRLPRQFP